MLLFTISSSSKDFKYHPKTKKIVACGTAYDYKTTKRKNFSGIGKWDISNVDTM